MDLRRRVRVAPLGWTVLVLALMGGAILLAPATALPGDHAPSAAARSATAPFAKPIGSNGNGNNISSNTSAAFRSELTTFLNWLMTAVEVVLIACIVILVIGAIAGRAYRKDHPRPWMTAVVPVGSAANAPVPYSDPLGAPPAGWNPPPSWTPPTEPSPAAAPTPAPASPAPEPATPAPPPPPEEPTVAPEGEP